LISGVDKDRSMPPEGKKPLGEKQIDLLRVWIDQGATWPDGEDIVDPRLDRAKRHWAFQRLEPTMAPARQSNDDSKPDPEDSEDLSSVTLDDDDKKGQDFGKAETD